MTEKISIKKSTIKKVVAITVVTVLLSVLGYAIYQAFVVDRGTLTTDISELQNELNQKKVEVARLEKQVADLQNEISLQDSALEQKNVDIEQLRNQTVTLYGQLASARNEIRNLTETIEELEALVKAYQNPTPPPVP